MRGRHCYCRTRLTAAEILRSYLKGEVLHDSVNIGKLANQRTHLFSGSDLRNLVVAAALAAFKDTVPDLWKAMDDSSAGAKEIPKRVIRQQHFDGALQEITASCASTMDTVEALRQWA